MKGVNKLKTISHRGIDIEIGVYIESLNFYANSVVSSNSGETAEECLKLTKKEIDKWFTDIPKNYNELAERIHGTCLEWQGYEDCSVEPKALELLIENFILVRSKR